MTRSPLATPYLVRNTGLGGLGEKKSRSTPSMTVSQQTQGGTSILSLSWITATASASPIKESYRKGCDRASGNLLEISFSRRPTSAALSRPNARLEIHDSL